MIHNSFKNLKKIKKHLGLLLILIYLLTVNVTPAFAGNYFASVFIILDDGSPIATEQTIRLSLWGDGRMESGDIASGVINTGADHYASYQTEITRTPDSLGRLRIALSPLPSFPDIDHQNQFLMVEYKDSGDPVTSYAVHSDFYINNTSLDRYPLIEDGPDIFGSMYSNDATTADIFVIDRDDSASTTVGIQIGSTSETLLWNVSSGQFELSDDLSLGLAELKDVVIDKRATDPVSPTVGQMYYNTTNNSMYVYDGGSWDAASGPASISGDLDAVYDNDSDQILSVDHANGLEFESSVSSNIIFDLQSTGDVVFQDAGTPFVTLSDIGQFDADGQVLLGDNGDTVEIDSSSWDISSSGVVSGFTGISSTGSIDFSNASSFLMHQGAANPGTCNEGQSFYNTTDNNLYVCTATNTWTSQSSSADDFEDIYANDDDDTLTTSNGNFTIDTGSGVFNVDNLRIDANTISSTNVNGNIIVDPNGTGYVNIGANTNIDGNTVTLDYDNSGGDITLQFGQSLAESLLWDNANTRFTFSDALRVEGNQATIGMTYIAGDHVATDSDGTINLGRNGSAWETWSFNSTADQFELSDDLNISGYLGLGTTSPNFNLHLYNTTSTIAHEWQVFDNGTDQISVLTGTQDPTLVATDADRGSIFLNATTGKFYIKTDDGSTVNWEKSGLSGDLLNALLGTYGTPSITNKFVTDEDPRLSATGGAFGEVSLGTRLDYDANFALDTSLIFYIRVFLPADTTMSTVGVYTTQNRTGDLNVGLYSDSNGPNTKLAETGAQTGTSPISDFWAYSFSTPYDITIADFYWLAIASDTNPSAQTYKLANDLFIPYRIESKAGASTVLPATATPDASPNTTNLPFIAGFE